MLALLDRLQYTSTGLESANTSILNQQFLLVQKKVPHYLLVHTLGIGTPEHTQMETIT